MSTQHGRMGRKRGIVKGSRGSGAGKKGKLAMQSAFLRGAKTTQRWNASKMAAARVLANASTAGFLGIEKKFLDTALADTAVTAAAALTGGEYDPSSGSTGCLSCPAQGDTEQSRDGKRIVIDALVLKGYVNQGSSVGEAPEADLKIFVAVVLDTQTNGAQLNSEDVFKSLSNSLATAVCPMKNLLFGNRFRILKSHVFDVSPQGIAPASATLAHNALRRDFDWYIPFKGGLPVNLNAGTTADVANVIDNSIHVVAFATDTGASIGYNARIRFQG